MSSTGFARIVVRTDKVLYLIGERPGRKAVARGGIRSSLNNYACVLPSPLLTALRIGCLERATNLDACSRSHSNPCSKAHADGTTRHHRSIDPPNIALADRFLPRCVCALISGLLCKIPPLRASSLAELSSSFPDQMSLE
ncbi:hypothetical protein D8B26_000761 [Coccidioides posadasii str. Silveira]|uniref:uncharacterized protein n=1 Tax=Coccidioides posadasii (strain RMSCC 757 / Silveira) TaxID=443226 RepID=UPI001BF0E79B|nr:hypothetical protein D8B26_000761 [Coccidioides posadasii str. Silveira]